jgi:hypothetical protein
MTKRVRKASSLVPDQVWRLCDRVREVLSLPHNSSSKEFDVFISYRQAESRALATQIFSALRRTRHPVLGRAMSVFLDDEQIKAGQNIHVTIQTAIRSSASFVILLSPTYNKTEYTAFEHMLISGEDWGGLQERIIPVLAQDCDIPERLRALKYLDLRSLVLQKSQASIESNIPLIRTHCLRVTQERFAASLAAHLGLGTIRNFGFIEELGDILPNGSYLELNHGTKISFSQFDIDAAITLVCKETAGGLVEAGFIVSGVVVKQSADRDGGFLPVDEPISILLEKLGRDLKAASTSHILYELESYAFDLPPEFDRSWLNGLPDPSPSKDLLHELINRQAWDDLRRCLIGIASLTQGIATLWTCEVVRHRSEIVDRKMQEELEASKPPNPEAIKTWAEQLLERWL